MKTKYKNWIMILATFFLVFACQNQSENLNEENQEKIDLKINTLTYKLDGVDVNFENISLTKNAAETFIGNESNGNYILINSIQPLVSGNFESDAGTPTFMLQIVRNNQYHDSQSDAANMQFEVTVNDEEVSGTFSGTVLRAADDVILNVTEGRFRVMK